MSDCVIQTGELLPFLSIPVENWVEDCFGKSYEI